MHPLEKSIQTTHLQVFTCRREETPLQDLRPQMNFEQRKVFKRAEVKVEEFILDQIGSLGIEINQKRLENCYLRNLIFSPQLFQITGNSLDCSFEHKAELIANYMGKRGFYKEFVRLVRNVYVHRKRYDIF